MKDKTKQKVYLWFLGGFLMPPIMWFFILWYSGLFDASDTIRLIHSPLMLTFLFLCNVCVFLVLHQKLKKIQRYLDDPSEQNLFPAQRSIYQLPLIFIILEAVYCLGGANVPLIGKEFIDSREYLLAWLFGVPIMTAYSLPFFILSTHNLEKWAHSVPVSERKAFLGFKTRFYIIISVASVGIIAMIFIFNDALLAKYSGIQLNIIRQKQIILGIISLISIMVAVIPFISLVSKQIGEMRKFVLLAGDGDFRGRIKIEERDELSALANTFNQMADRATERKAEIISATNRLNAIIDSATGFYISTTDMKGDITSWNKGAEQIMGYTEDEVIGKMNFSEIIYDEGEVLADLKKIIKGLSEGKTYERELNMERKDGLVFPALVSSSPLKDEMENQIGILVVFQDITKLKQAEESLRRAKEKAEKTNLKLKESIERTKTMAVAAQAASVSKSRFLANMSHEIRTPMNGVIGFTDMLLDSDLDETQIDYARTIKNSGNMLLALINDILDFSKIEAGDLNFEEIDFDPEILAYDVCDLIRPKAESKPIEILCRIGDNLPATVKGDPTRFRQVLTNLMGNAPKFTEAGEIELSLDVEEEKDDRIKLHAKIRDTGIGISKENLSKIFEVFQQADGSTTRKYGGTGLGLSISKELVSLMHGDVWVESELNQGSVFHFTAWLKKAEQRKTERLTPVSLSGKKVLIIDDNLSNLNILTHAFESVGIRVTSLTHGKEVVSTLQKAMDAGEPFDLCVSDIQMPEMSGYEVARLVRGTNKFPNLPLIALSSLMERDAKKCYEAGFMGFLNKPVRRGHLFQMLERILGESKKDWKKDETEKHEIMTQYSVREEMKRSVRILLAEDNPVNQKLARIMLTKAGYQVEVANDGREAVEMLTASPETFDLIFMDVQMPEMDGLEATKEIRKRGFADIPIVAMTAHAMEGDREKCLKAGMDDYTTKPIKREIVFEALKKWVFDKEAV